MELVLLFTGRNLEARMLEDALRQHGIPSLLRAAEAYRGIIGDAALPIFEEVLISRADLEGRSKEIEECLDFVRQGVDDPVIEEADTAE